jgi:hypothetical protein
VCERVEATPERGLFTVVGTGKTEAKRISVDAHHHTQSTRRRGVQCGALAAGVNAYVVKSNAAKDLIPELR